MPMNCLMPHCRHRRDINGCNLHHFPPHEPIRSLWVKACRRFHKESDGTITPWAGPGAQSVICSCHFSEPLVHKRGRKHKSAPGETPPIPHIPVPDSNLPDRDYLVFKGFRGERKYKMEGKDNEDESDDDDEDGRSGRSSSRVNTPYDEAILTAMEIPNAQVTTVDSLISSPPSTSGVDASTLNPEPPPKKARKSMKGTARKSASRPEYNRVEGEEEPFFSPEFLESLAPRDQIYIPPNPPDELEMTIQHHDCNACGSKFVLKSSLLNHLSRNVMEITYVCRACPQIVMFGNRCAFLNHCLFHDPLADRDQLCRRAVVRMTKTLPSSRNVDLTLDPNITNLDSMMIPDYRMEVESRGDPIMRMDSMDIVEESSSQSVGQEESRKSIDAPRYSVEAGESSKDCDSRRESTETPGEKVPNEELKTDKESKEGDEVAKTHCPECNASFQGQPGFMAHFGSCKRPVLKFTCQECFMILSSKCCLRSHMRVHTGEKPCVCFMCASVIAEPVFEKHLNEKCLAFCRRLVTDCPICETTLKSVKEYMEHLMNRHVNTLQKCPYCGMAYNSEEKCKEHQMSEHGVMSVAGDVLKCPLCSSLFPIEAEAQLKVHLERNHVKTIVEMGTFQFVCQLCDDKPCYTLKKDLFSHYREFHKERYHPYSCNECEFDGGSASKLAAHILTDHEPKKIGIDLGDIEELPSPNLCPICQQECGDKPDIYAHRKEHETFDNRFWCFVCRDIFSSRQALVQHERICTRNTDEDGELLAYLCDICSQTFLDKEDFDSHYKEEHDTHHFPCGICGLTYTSQDDLTTHTTEAHFREKKKLPYFCEVCQKKGVEKGFSAVMWLRRHITIVHKNKSRQIIPDEDKSDEVNKVKSPDALVKHLKRYGETTFSCAQCDFNTEERDSFQNHIHTHKSEDSFQCPECGLNFVVQTSVRKHLLMVHKMKHIDSYMEEFFPEKDSPQKNGFVVDESLNCSVCSKHYDDLASLKSHWRSHGMAYLSTKKNETTKA